MYKKLSVLLVIISLISVLNFNAFADVREENIELYLVIDKSKSMVEEISDVSSYINSVFIDDFLIPGDRLILIEFYGRADLVFNGLISSENKAVLMKDISGIPANGRFTDIGNALDNLEKAVNSGADRLERKYLILLTDGKQEAPPESPYYTPDGSFNHEFLENTKIIQKAGWKIIIIGIGNDTAVKELAEELATTHEVLDFEESIPEAKSSSELLGRILSDSFYIDKNHAYLSLKSEGYTDERTISIEQITYQLYSGNYPLLNDPVSVIIKPNSEQKIELELSQALIDLIENTGREGSIIFNFSGDTPFLPAVFDSIIITAPEPRDTAKKVSEFSKNSKNKGFNWLILIVIILIAAVVIAFIIIRNIILHRDDDETKKRTKNAISDDS